MLALPLLAACDTELHLGGEADATVSSACLEADKHSDFAFVRDEVFPISCSNFMRCHRSAPRAAADLDLTAAKAYDNLVNQMTESMPNAMPRWLRVDPGHPERSYILVKLGDIKGVELGDGEDYMPPNSPPLCKQKIGAIKRWIEAGAPP